MQQFNKRLITSALALVLVCGVSLSGSAAAEHGSNSGSDSTSVSGSHDATESSTEVAHAVTSTHDSTENETEQEIQKSQVLREQFKEQAHAKVQADLKDKAQTKTKEQKQQACTARKANLTKRMNHAVAGAQKHKDNIDKTYAKVKAFHDAKNLNVANYDTLTAAVDKAQSDATAQIAALKALNISVDCTQTDSLATNITAFQTAVKSTRDSLKAYRSSLVDLITALHGASTSTDDSSTNGTTAQ
jgi:hypothetical protein